MRFVIADHCRESRCAVTSKTSRRAVRVAQYRRSRALALSVVGVREAMFGWRDTQQVHPCMLALGIPASHGPTNQTSLLARSLIISATREPPRFQEASTGSRTLSDREHRDATALERASTTVGVPRCYPRAESGSESSDSDPFNSS